jgi:hypothetical protein
MYAHYVLTVCASSTCVYVHCMLIVCADVCAPCMCMCVCALCAQADVLAPVQRPVHPRDLLHPAHVVNLTDMYSITYDN